MFLPPAAPGLRPEVVMWGALRHAQAEDYRNYREYRDCRELQDEDPADMQRSETANMSAWSEFKLTAVELNRNKRNRTARLEEQIRKETHYEHNVRTRRGACPPTSSRLDRPAV